MTNMMTQNTKVMYPMHFGNTRTRLYTGRYPQYNHALSIKHSNVMRSQHTSLTPSPLSHRVNHQRVQSNTRHKSSGKKKKKRDGKKNDIPTNVRKSPIQQRTISSPHQSSMITTENNNHIDVNGLNESILHNDDNVGTKQNISRPTVFKRLYRSKVISRDDSVNGKTHSHSPSKRVTRVGQNTQVSLEGNKTNTHTSAFGKNPAVLSHNIEYEGHKTLNKYTSLRSSQTIDHNFTSLGHNDTNQSKPIQRDIISDQYSTSPSPSQYSKREQWNLIASFSNHSKDTPLSTQREQLDTRNHKLNRHETDVARDQGYNTVISRAHEEKVYPNVDNDLEEDIVEMHISEDTTNISDWMCDDRNTTSVSEAFTEPNTSTNESIVLEKINRIWPITTPTLATNNPLETSPRALEAYSSDIINASKSPPPSEHKSDTAMTSYMWDRDEVKRTICQINDLVYVLVNQLGFETSSHNTEYTHQETETSWDALNEVYSARE